MTFCQHCDVCSCDAQSLDVLEVEGDHLECAVHVKLLAASQREVLDVQLPEAWAGLGQLCEAFGEHLLSE